MSRKIYHCATKNRDNKGRVVALCGHTSEGYIKNNPKHIFDYFEDWLPSKDNRPSWFWKDTERCQECVAHEDYPLLVLAHV